jgi:flagellar biogenesis protein FliO
MTATHLIAWLLLADSNSAAPTPEELTIQSSIAGIVLSFFCLVVWGMTRWRYSKYRKLTAFAALLLVVAECWIVWRVTASFYRGDLPSSKFYPTRPKVLTMSCSAVR